MFRKLNTSLLTIAFKSIAVLPFSILSALSNFIYLLLYRVLHYRKKVVNINLKSAFPQSNNNQIKSIERKYYRHLAQLIVETIKGYFMTPKQLLERVILTQESQQLIQNLSTKKQNIVLMLGHYGNWEWPLLIMQKFTTHRPFALYAPLSSDKLDQFIKGKRERFGTTMLDATKPRSLLSHLRSQPFILAVVGDQSPTGRSNTHSTNFLAMNTLFFTGGEKIAEKMDAAVIYVHLEKIAFAQYIIHLELLTDDMTITQKGDITDKYAKKLENSIRQQPEFWIWSHKRWKNILSY